MKNAKTFFKSIELRIIQLKNGYEDMSNLLGRKVESVTFNEHVQQNTTKIEKLESNIAFLKGEFKSLQENDQHLSN